MKRERRNEKETCDLRDIAAHVRVCGVTESGRDQRQKLASQLLPTVPFRRKLGKQRKLEYIWIQTPHNRGSRLLNRRFHYRDRLEIKHVRFMAGFGAALLGSFIVHYFDSSVRE